MRRELQLLLALSLILSGCGGGGGGSSQASVDGDNIPQALPALEVSVSEIEFRKLGSDEPLQPDEGN